MSTLLVRPDAGDSWAWADAAGSGQGSITDLAAAAAGRPLVLAVPGAAVTLTTAQAPRRNQRAWRQALPYALEDQLATDVAQLHFALSATETGRQTAIAVIARERLESWLAALREQRLTAVAAYPDMLLLPLPAHGWSLLVDGDRVLVRSGPTGGFVTETVNLALLLRQALASATDEPEILHLWGQLTPPPELGVTWQSEPAAPPLAVLRRGLAAPPLNLLQGDYGPASGVARWLKPWRAAALLTAMIVASQLANNVLEYVRLEQAHARLERTEVQLYRRIDPKAQRVFNPRAQLAGLLRSRDNDQTNSGGFLELLQQGGAVLRQFPELRLQALRFADGELRLDLQGGSLQTLERLQTRLRSLTPVTAKLQVSQQEGTVAGQLMLRARGTP